MLSLCFIKQFSYANIMLISVLRAYINSHTNANRTNETQKMSEKKKRKKDEFVTKIYGNGNSNIHIVNGYSTVKQQQQTHSKIK